MNDTQLLIHQLQAKIAELEIKIDRIDGILKFATLNLGDEITRIKDVLRSV